MGRKGSVEKLAETEFNFVINCVLDGMTDNEISFAFETEFGEKLPKSNLNNWRHRAGDELKEKYKLARYQARTLIENLKADGQITDESEYQVLIKTIEDKLLSATRDFTQQNPLKLFFARQEEERLKIKRDQLDLNREKLAFEKERFEREASVRTDRLAIGAEVWKYLLIWFSTNEPHLADGLTRNSDKFLTDLEEHLGNQNS